MVEESGVDRVRVAVAGEIVEISLRDRGTLLQELCLIPGCKPIREKFEAAGQHRWVELDSGQRSRLRAVVEVWDREGLAPEGIKLLLSALVRVDSSGMDLL